MLLVKDEQQQKSLEDNIQNLEEKTYIFFRILLS